MNYEAIEQTHSDLHQLVGMHVRWKIRFRNAITHKLRFNIAVIRKDDCCDFGKWLHGDGKKYARFPAYNNLLAQHAEFHKQAALVATEANANNNHEVESMLSPSSPFNKAFAEISATVTTLMKQAGVR